MQTNQNQPMKTALPKNLKAENPSKEEGVLNYINSVTNNNPLKTAWSHPVGKTIILTGGMVLAIWGTAYLLRLLAWWRIGYNQFKAVGNCPVSLPPKV